MKYRIFYYYKGSQSPSSRIIEAKNEKDALAILQGASGSNPNYEITSVICESESVCSPSTQFNKQASESEAANKLTAYKSRQRLKEEKPMWFFTLDAEKIEGPVVLESIQYKVDIGILKEDSLVMKAGKDWMTVSEFKNMSIPFVASKPSPSITQTRNAKVSPFPTSGPSHRLNRASEGNKDHKTSKRVDMSDELVKRAIQRGLRSKHFHEGAQSNANSAWLFGLIGAGVGFFFSWKVAIVFGLIAIWSIVRSMQATTVALRLEKLESE